MKNIFPPETSSINFDLRQLEIFQKVVELESFSKAAVVVALAQASVSERIATLESAIGAKLLDRLGRRVVPTKVGELVYKHAVLLLDMKKTACLEIQDFLGMKNGEILMGGSTIPGEYILPALIERFRRKYPLISIKLTIGDTNKIENQVLEGGLEIGVIGSKSQAKTIASYELWKDELALVIPAAHKWAKRKQIPLEEIFEEAFILREVGSGTLDIMEKYLNISSSSDKIFKNVVARLGSSTAVKEGIKSGLGVSILSLRAVETEVKEGLLKALKVNGLSMSRSFYLIRDKRRIASPLCQAMLDFLMGARP